MNNVPLLNSDQLRSFNAIIGAINDTDQNPKVHFVDESGGTSKTCHYKLSHYWLEFVKRIKLP